jgi:hypothetical protein
VPWSAAKKKLPEREAGGDGKWDLCALHALAALYERLRGQILHGLHGGQPVAGLGVLMHQGMRAWMERCRESAHAIGNSGDAATPPVTIPSPLQTQVVGVIACMILNHKRKELS